MAHHNTVFVQLLRFLPRHEFEAEARQHQRGQGLRVMSRWAQFVALGLAQLTGRQSLRDIVSNLSTQGRKLYHLGVGTTVSRSSLARVNAERQCRAAVHSLRDAVRTPAEPLSAVRAEARLSVQEQVVTRSMRRPSICVWRSSRGRLFDARRLRSSCTSGWIRRAICRASSV